MDRKQIQHDLALAYAKAKMEIALERGELDHKNVDEPTAAAQDLLSWYLDCLNELSQIKVEDFVDLWGTGSE